MKKILGILLGMLMTYGVVAQNNSIEGIVLDNKSEPLPAELVLIDAGDYHFMIRVTDKEGWQTMKGLSLKIR